MNQDLEKFYQEYVTQAADHIRNLDPDEMD